MAISRLDVDSAVDRLLFESGRGHLMGFPTQVGATCNSSGVPTNGTAGWAPGAIWFNFLDTTGLKTRYKNVGSNTSSIWVLDASSSQAGGKVTISNDTVAGNSTFTAAQLLGRYIERGGSQTAAFTDTTDTMPNILAGTTGLVVNDAIPITIDNNTPFSETIAGGASVTMAGITVVPKNSWADFLLQYTSATAMTLTGLRVGGQLQLPRLGDATQSIGTVGGAGTAAFTISAAQMVLGEFGTLSVTGNGTGTLTGTLDTTANIIAAVPNAQVGEEFRTTIINNCTVTLTLAAGDASTILAGSATIAANGSRSLNLVINTASGAGSITVNPAGMTTSIR